MPSKPNERGPHRHATRIAPRPYGYAMIETDFVGARLGAFVADADGAALHSHVLHEGKRSLLNFFGCAIAAGRAEACDTLVRVLRTFGAGGTGTLLGRADRLVPPD